MSNSSWCRSPIWPAVMAPIEAPPMALKEYRRVFAGGLDSPHPSQGAAISAARSRQTAERMEHLRERS
jgi:hypothetical protein